jgi:hypothetical protein
MMENYQAVLQRILQNNAAFSPGNRKEARRVLILYEQPDPFIGDTLCIFDNLKFCKYYFDSAVIDLCFRQGDKFLNIYNAMLRYNPYLDNIYDRDWTGIDFGEFDVVLICTPMEADFLKLLAENCGDSILAGKMQAAVFSTSAVFIYEEYRAEPVFPGIPDMFEHFKGLGVRKCEELYISKEEREWADDWLRTKGLKEDESLFVVLDSASTREKLLRMDIYCEVLSGFLTMGNAKVLIFDEKEIGKESFYNELLGEQLTSRIIFSKRMGFRNDLSLIGSNRTKMVFGPCTGLLHCASAIYNHFVKKGMAARDVPVMIVYTGQYPKRTDAQRWWGDSPLVTCLLLKNSAGKIILHQLHKMNDADKANMRDVLTTKEYTSDMILDVVNQELAIK